MIQPVVTKKCGAFGGVCGNDATVDTFIEVTGPVYASVGNQNHELKGYTTQASISGTYCPECSEKLKADPGFSPVAFVEGKRK